MFGFIFLELMLGYSSDDGYWCFISVGFSVGSEEVASGGWFVSNGFKQLLEVDGNGQYCWFLSWPSSSESNEIS